ncbi:F-box protein At3g62230-like [Tasmannia lanceolata]|uniref:F-box protein At3g62230-like n=1 Tax=Tasmannia lanceolata TaxID=3420 RepID=UPI00406349EB
MDRNVDRSDRNVDRISQLPNSILAGIISRLSFKEGVRTSILAKRWINIWRSTGDVALYENLFIQNDNRRELLKDGRKFLATCIRNHGKQRFIAFAREFLQTYQENEIENFRLSFCHPKKFISEVQGWIQFAITRNAKNLDLDFSDIDMNGVYPSDYIAFFELPDFVYEHRSLGKLKLTACDFKPSDFSKFNALKALSISRVKLSQRSLETLISNCPLVENLSIKKCSDMEYMKIVADGNHRLTSLTIKDCKYLENGITIDVPNLQYLKFFGAFEVFELNNLLRLIHAEFDFGLEDEFHEVGDILGNLLRGVDCASSLTLCSYTTQVITSGEEPLYLPTPLLELRHLTLKIALHINELPGVACLLRSCHKLETLTLEIVKMLPLDRYVHPYKPIYDGAGFWASQVLHFKCLRKCLKSIKVVNFGGSENEFQILQFLLGGARALKELEIVTSKPILTNGDFSEEFMNIAARLHQFERASPAIQVVICENQVI